MREFALLSDGGEVTLLDDPGWTTTAPLGEISLSHVVRNVYNCVLPDDAEETGETHEWQRFGNVCAKPGLRLPRTSSRHCRTASSCASLTEVPDGQRERGEELLLSGGCDPAGLIRLLAGQRFWSAVGMDPRTVLARFDEQLRKHPLAGPGEHIEAGERVTRRIGAADGWTGVIWSDLDEASAGPIIDAQIRRFAALGQPWEWKYYSYDQPADLPERLRAAGLTPAEPEALLVAETDALALAAAPTSSSAPGVTLADITGPAGADELVWVHDEVFGGSHAAIGRAVLAGLDREPPDVIGVVARTGAAPVAAARVDFPAGADFAGLWGGGTLPGWRGRGIFRALVAHRAALAAARGYRYLQADALPTSAPILQRLGFVRLATTVPFSYPGTGS